MTRLHATCIAIGARGVLLTGPSGSGKSDLAMRLIDRGASLVADDQTEVRAEGGRLIGWSPATIAGRIELRGIGILERRRLPSIAIAIAVALDRAPDRLPPDTLPERVIEGVAVPELALAAFEASAPLKVEHALALFGLAA